MSNSAVTRDGLEQPRPGREARTWSSPSGLDGKRPRDDRPAGSYHGKPIIKEPVWEELDIAGYLFAGGLAGASSILAAGAELTGRTRLARRSKLAASAAIGASLFALVHDLGRPGRFLNMLRVFKPTSPMNVGAWLLGAYGPLNAACTASDIFGRAPRSGRVASVGAGILGAGVATYTAALISDTAVPAWHEAHRELPALFAGSAASAAGGLAMVSTPLAESAPARRLAILGAATELVADRLMERRLGMIAETLHEGTAGKRLRLAKGLTAAGLLGAGTVARRSGVGARASGAALVLASALTRFGIFAAGIASARDPKYTVEPQRERAGKA